MGMGKRAWLTVKAKANKALDGPEDPRETLDYSYQRQLEMLEQVERGVADVAASRESAESQISILRQEQAEIVNQARLAGTTDGERQLLRRKSAVDRELAGLATRHEALLEDEKQLMAACMRLKAKVDAFRMNKDIIKATYSAAEAQTVVGQALSRISEEMDRSGTSTVSYERRQELLAQLLGGIKGMSAAREHMGRQVSTLRQQQAELERRATQALDAGEADLAQQALTQKDEIGSQLPDLEAQLRSLQEDEDKFTQAYVRLATIAETSGPRPGNTSSQVGKAPSDTPGDTSTGDREAPDDPASAKG